MAILVPYTLTTYGPNQDIGAPPEWHTFEIEAGTTDGNTTEDIPVIALPANTIVHDFVMSCTLPEAGATSQAGTLMLETLNVSIMAPTADNMGTIAVTEVNELIVGTGTTSWFPLVAADELRLSVGTVGAASTGGKVKLSVLLSRYVRP